MIKIEEISKSYGTVQVLDHISLTVGDGQTIAVTGESGCGKTTMLRIIAGLEKSDSGSVWINGIRMNDRIEPYQRKIAMVFQDATLWNHMTVRKNITFGSSKKKDKKIAELADFFGVGDLLDRYPEEISGGQAKRVSLIRALASDRDILLLDEPLSNIDEDNKIRILAYMKEHVCGEKTVLYVTHDEKEVAQLGCEVMRL